jgi:hypothetical protein
MKVIITKKIGTSSVTFEVDEGKTKDALYRTTNFTSIPEKCSLCKSTNLELQGNTGKDKAGKVYQFVKVICLDCHAQAKMGESLDGVNVFWKDFETYTPKE